MGRPEIMENLPIHQTLVDALRQDRRPQRVIAGLAGVSDSTLSGMLSQRQYGSLKSWQRLLDACGLEIVVRKKLSPPK